MEKIGGERVEGKARRGNYCLRRMAPRRREAR